MAKPSTPRRKIKVLATTPEDYFDATPAEVAALRAMMTGQADADQQMRGMKCIVEKISQAYQPSYRPNDKGGDRASAYLEGRRSVGLWIINLQHMSPKEFEKES